MSNVGTVSGTIFSGSTSGSSASGAVVSNVSFSGSISGQAIAGATTNGVVFNGTASGNEVHGDVNKKNTVSGDIMHTVLKGQSAYEEAVANGFVGTEQEWLASLDATVEVGEVTIGDELAIENVGTPHNAVLNFTMTDGDYEALRRKPSIESVTLSGDKTFSDLGLASIGADDLLEILV